MNPYDRGRTVTAKMKADGGIWTNEQSPVDPKRQLHRLWRTIDSDKLDDILFKSPANVRILDGISPESLSDILPSIKKSKRNTFPVYAVVSESDPDKIEIIDGFRRFSAVKLVPDAKLFVVVYKHLTQEEKEHFVKVSDIQREISLYEWGLDIKRFLDDQEKLGKKWLNKELTDIYPLSETKISTALSAIRLPIELVKELPTLNHVSATWTRSILSLKLDDETLIAVASSYTKPAKKEGEDIDAYATRVRNALLSAAKKIKMDRTVGADSTPLKTWEDMPKGIKATQTGAGTIKISISAKALTAAQKTKLRELLASFND